MGWILGAALVAALLMIVWLTRRLDAARRQTEIAQTERDRARDEASQLHARWDTVTRSVGEGVILIDADEQIVFLNDAAKTLLGLHDAMGHPFGEIAWRLQMQPLVGEVLAGRAESLSQTVVKDERAFQVHVRACAADSSCGAVIVFSEVTELQRLGRVRREFVANISHELRTPVATLQLLADTVANEIRQNPSAASEWLEKMSSQIDVLHQLTRELMDLALIESGQMPIKLIDIPVAELVTQVVALFEPQIERKQIAIENQVPPALCALADPGGVRRVLSNLLHNAIKFTPTNGRIAIRAKQVADNIEIQIEDTGIGIPARDLPRVFERFYKVDRSRVEGEMRGTGLGLAIAKHIIEGHGGRIWAESVEGKGSTFHFTLPAAS